MIGPSSQRLADATTSACRARIERLREVMDRHGVDTLLVSNEKDILYLSGFVGHDSLLLVFGDGAAIVTDARYDEFLNPWRESGLVEVLIGVRHRLHQTVRDITRTRRTKRIGFQGESLTVAGLSTLAATIGRHCLVDTRGLVTGLRRRKDELEIATIERAIAIQQEALGAALEQLVLGMTERDLCAIVEHEMKSRGAFGASFDTMVAASPNTSVIHYMTGSTPIGEGLLLIDWGASVDGYCSDLTRTFSVGPMAPKMQSVYDVVLDAQRAAIDACAAGRSCAEIDGVARGIIAGAGYGEYFSHGLGHGLGLDVHEDPYFNELSTSVILEPGMVMTVEPGIYLPGSGGVRIEDDVLITDDGCRVLSDYPKSLEAAVLETRAETPLAKGVP